MHRKEVLVTALRAAGTKMLTYEPGLVKTDIKSNVGDLVTEADLASEKIITDTIKKAFPADIIISEETATSHTHLEPKNLSQLTAWVVDPIDGTTNFKRGFNYSGVSIGYIQNGQSILGGILDPYHNNLYLAETDKGATCNGKSLRVSDKTQFDFSTRVCTSNSFRKMPENLNLYSKLGDVWVDVLGSGVLIMADVASGRLDLYYHNGLKPWDNAAGFLLAKEAGAKIVDWKGEPATWLTSEVVMGNPDLVNLFVKKIGTPQG